jgi:hypothetical protein
MGCMNCVAIFIEYRRLAGPVLSLGPAMSIRILQFLPVSCSAWRTNCTMCCQAEGSSCAQLMRAQSMPRNTSSRTNT